MKDLRSILCLRDRCRRSFELASGPSIYDGRDIASVDSEFYVAGHKRSMFISYASNPQPVWVYTEIWTTNRNEVVRREIVMIFIVNREGHYKGERASRVRRILADKNEVVARIRGREEQVAKTKRKGKKKI